MADQIANYYSFKDYFIIKFVALSSGRHLIDHLKVKGINDHFRFEV